MASGPVPNPIVKHVSPAHIDKVLDYGNEQAKREDSQQTQSKWMAFGGCILFLALVVFLVVFLKDSPTILAPVLSAVAGLVSGFMAGFGVGKRS